MQVISRGTTVSATSAEQLVFFGVSGGWLTDVFALEFQIWRGAAQVFPATIGQRQSVDIVNDRLGKGRYAASWLVPSDATTGAYEVRWFYQLTSGGPELRATTRFEVVTTPTAGTFYAGPSDLAAEGADIAEARALIADGQIDILFANEHELAALTGVEDFHAGIEQLAEIGRAHV